MIRGVALVSLIALLVLVLYLPSAHPPERFVEQLRAEHATAAAFWGHAPAAHMLSRALSVQESARSATPLPSPGDAPDIRDVNVAVANEMTSVNQRLFNNAYFRSIDALLLLASFRLATLLEWLPWLLAFVAAAMVDGYFVRSIRAKEFLHHDPELFAVYASGAIVVICGTVLAFVLPVNLHPMILPCVPLVIGVLLSRALGSFHRRG